jgi:acyl-CoA synthetase (AMP-forming)/AMP-acid ligase II
LDCHATKLASHLQAHNVRPETRVALCFDKSVRSFSSIRI